MELILPSIEYKNSYINYIQELGDEQRYPFPMDFDYSDFKKLLEKISDFSKGVNLPDSYVPSSTFWLVESGEIVGVTNIRHYLNPTIRDCGGHIGLGIRPSCRSKGLGTYLMGLSVEKLMGMGQHPIHIHCYKANVASANAILKNGGVLDSELELENKVVQRYVVRAIK